MKGANVIMVDREDREIGVMEKIEAHRKAILHRAISVFIINSRGEWLLHRRALGKYHSGGLWTNTCCTHPFPGESISNAAVRRLREEMGLDCKLMKLFSFIYREPINHELTEHEYDHVFVGFSDKMPVIDTSEIMDWKYLSYFDLEKEVRSRPDDFTSWFIKIFERVHQHMINC